MKYPSEEAVTRILTDKEIINRHRISKPISSPDYNLGDFLASYKPPKSPYEGKYIFIR